MSENRPVEAEADATAESGPARAGAPTDLRTVYNTKYRLARLRRWYCNFVGSLTVRARKPRRR